MKAQVMIQEKELFYPIRKGEKERKKGEDKDVRKQHSNRNFILF